MDKSTKVIQAILSFVAITAVIGLWYYESVTNANINSNVYYILWGAVFWLNLRWLSWKAWNVNEVMSKIFSFKKDDGNKDWWS